MTSRDKQVGANELPVARMRLAFEIQGGPWQEESSLIGLSGVPAHRGVGSPGSSLASVHLQFCHSNTFYEV